MTTVTVSSATHKKLKKLKKKRGTKSFNQLLNEIADEQLDIPDSDEMFGSMEIEASEEVRDHGDRADRYD